MLHFEKHEATTINMNKKTTILKAFFLCILMLGSVFAFSQEMSFDPRTKDEILIYEKINDGVLTDSIGKFGILKNPQFDVYTLVQTKVWIFKRLEDDFNPQLHVWYYFDKNTNELKAITYNWGLFNPSFNPRERKEELIELTTREKEFKKKYNGLKKELKGKLGKPSKSETIANNANSFVENVFWGDNEKITELSIRFDRKLQEIPGAGITSDFHISTMVTFK